MKSVNSKKHEYYFPEGFEWNMPLFNDVAFTSDLRWELFTTIEWYDRVNVPTLNGERAKQFTYVSDKTLWNDEHDNKHGVFHYYWFNAFVREVGYVGWRCHYQHQREQGASEKEAMKVADGYLREYNNFVKEKFA